MAMLSKEEILKLSRLARIQVDESEISSFQNELSSILDYFKILDKADIEGLKPTYQVTGLANVTRKDEIMDYGVTKEELLKNVPDVEAGHIKVKRMVG